jgi:hypothetical protein
VFATVIEGRIVRVERSARIVADLMQPVLRTASRKSQIAMVILVKLP